MREVEERVAIPGLVATDAAMGNSRNDTHVGSNRSYEIMVRMADGSHRVINHDSPASWRPGERVVIIGGTNPPGK